MQRVRVAISAAALVLLSACSGEGDTGAARSPGPRAATTPAVTASATPAASVSAAAPTATPTPTGSAAPRTPARDGDVDGDGRVDRVTATQELLTVRLASGRTLTAEVVADAEPPVQGVVDVDRDGRAEVFLETTRGASTAFYTPFRYDGTSLRALVLDGEPVRLGVGGSITHGDGFACTGGRVVVSSSSSDDGETFEVTTTTYAVRGHALARVSRSTARGLAQGDRRVAASYQVSCGSVTQDG